MMADSWFFEQFDSPADEKAETTAKAPVAQVTRQRVLTLSIRNRTYLHWKVTLHGSKTTDARASSLNLAPLEAAPNDSASCTLVRLIRNEGLRVDRIEVASALSSCATLTLCNDERRSYPWLGLAEHTDLSLCVEWGSSDEMPGHAVPTLRVETIRLDS